MKMKPTEASMFKDLPPEIQRMIRQTESLRKHMPWTIKLLQQDGFSFRGLSIFPSDKGGYVVAVRVYRSDGQPQVAYCNGASPYEAFLGIETAVLLDKFYVDKKAEDYQPQLPSKL